MKDTTLFDAATVAGLTPGAFMAYGPDPDIDVAVDQVREASFALYGESGQQPSLACLEDVTVQHHHDEPLPIGLAIRYARAHLSAGGELAAWRIASKAKRRKVTVRTTDIGLAISDGTSPGILHDVSAELWPWLATQIGLAGTETVESAELQRLDVRHTVVLTRRKGPNARALAVLSGDLVVGRGLTSGEASKLAKSTALERGAADVVALVTRVDGAQLSAVAQRKRLSARLRVTVADLSTAAKPAGWLIAGTA